MRAKIRTTGAGTEYWDTEEKRTVFVPTGAKPNFEVTDEYESLIHKEEKKEVEDMPFGVNDGKNDHDLSGMNLKDLKALAAENKIVIPKEVTKKEAVAKYIFDNWATEEDEIL